MKKTTTQYFCDLCKEEIKEVPTMHYVTQERYGGDCLCSCVDVNFVLNMYGYQDSTKNIICTACKLQVLEELIKFLKKGE